jgi:hypothetical protein
VTDPVKDICQRSDAGETPAQISAALAIPAGKVYAILRQHRPSRPRAPRTRTSEVPARVVALATPDGIKTSLAAVGIKAKDIAKECGVSEAYVHRIIQEARRVIPPPPPPHPPIPPPPY